MKSQKYGLKPAIAGPLKPNAPTHGWLKCLGVCLALILNVPVVMASNVILSWQPSSSPSIAGYNIYYGGNSGIYTNKVSAGNNTSVTFSNLVAGSTYYFAATCYNAAGDESPRSNEAVYTVPATPTGLPVVLGKPSLSGRNFSFTVPSGVGTNFAVEASVDLVKWVRLATNTAPFTFVDPNSIQFTKRFYRAVILPGPTGSIVPRSAPAISQW